MARWISTSFMCFLLLTVALMLWYASGLLSRLSQPSLPAKPEKTHLLLLSSWRSGSSFLGQMFNQNPEVFYLKEPAWHLWNRLQQKGPERLQRPIRDLLRSIFLCDTSALKPYMGRSEFVSDLFSWIKSRALCSAPACSTFPSLGDLEESHCSQICSRTPFQKMEEVCRSYSHVVVKAVRILDLEAFYPLLEDPSLNLKIIHLVRDPRAVLSSREHTKGLEMDDMIITGAQKAKPNASMVMQEVCKAQVRIHNASLPLKDRYLLVRYEDLAKDPLSYAASLFEYASLSLSPRMVAWVHHNTHPGVHRNQGFLMYSKDAKVVSQYWREKLSFQKAKQVQEICRQAMNIFGYQFIGSEVEQKDMSLTLVSP
ncbi:carbohydrate sulfotransferase 5-like [Rhinatrema bivittatum]|uniref:carbohydrate sulfotransferase 5-like n=1 Tax=Rhinatrema bivittatum TaxID=194408 RepID=UPI00112E9D57|nr:carbohydrate sulfotransferase 5-like [Rhinatrema bivittatum]